MEILTEHFLFELKHLGRRSIGETTIRFQDTGQVYYSARYADNSPNEGTEAFGKGKQCIER